ncbi:hypothetical protein DSLASN_13020 [Desulfoluna limicola]|uniref:PAS fold-4 domain-containing protein n=1 Tax=Desulfoluna limicola TaxID=2810562 RepID=A0ABN6F231_9BACT|nr:PAS domain-containing protein [Desulfoluna limicola]BCS95670.1 hypothetical protein DSLASN_13020 [Desulfoluna limicola]
MTGAISMAWKGEQMVLHWMRRRTISADEVLKALPDLVFVFDRDGRYLKVMGGAERRFYDDASFLKGKLIHDVLPVDAADHYLSIIHRVLDTQTIQVVEYNLSSEDLEASPKDGPSGEQWFQGRVAPLHIGGEPLGCVLWTVINITEKKKAEMERDRAMAELENALAEINTLKGILPICSACKKIRDEGGGWHQLEDYISDHSDADFSHGICPDCMKTLYPECCREDEQGP